MIKTLIVLRHAQSTYNAAKVFTGWTDCPLTDAGEQQATIAGQQFLKHYGACIEKVFCSAQQRALITAQRFLQASGHPALTIEQHADLNERDYGKLNGVNKSKACRIYGKEQVAIWRRSFHATPPGGESLRTTQQRAAAYLHSTIFKSFNQHGTILIASHGNTLRGIVGHMLNLDEDSIKQTIVGWAEPCVLTLCHTSLRIQSITVLTQATHNNHTDTASTSIPFASQHSICMDTETA